jgi:hypothetical protein
MAVMTGPLIRAYARRIGADFVCLEHPSAAPHCEKFQLSSLLLKYDRIIYLDTDLIVNDSCPNLLVLVPQKSFGAWFPSRMARGFEGVIAEAQKSLGDIGWKSEYFNSGVMVISRGHRAVFEGSCSYTDGFFEQTFLNYRVQMLKLPVHDIGWQCNHTGRVRSSLGRLKSHIIHYAGAGHVPGVSRVEQIRNDLRTLGKL